MAHHQFKNFIRVEGFNTQELAHAREPWGVFKGIKPESNHF